MGVVIKGTASYGCMGRKRMTAATRRSLERVSGLGMMRKKRKERMVLHSFLGLCVFFCPCPVSESVDTAVIP